MKNSENAKAIVQNLPRGVKKCIAENTGLSYNTVCRFFKGKRTEIKTSKLITENLRNIEKEYNESL
ncbi:hypothetical protein [Flavobacterium psychrophilum]|uniref:hypothetical protein n=1 Tax=Flavobacterium psychrophilum TaxID=96345 RepID=UPI000B7C5280|nr:hypothetical protein [Flavobacterium psychrophilum]SNA88299.1 hypothetical protein FI146_840162 [Flavobacterium psychrophilum]